jgi:hypothetical protein
MTVLLIVTLIVGFALGYALRALFAMVDEDDRFLEEVDRQMVHRESVTFPHRRGVSGPKAYDWSADEGR